MQNLRSKLAAVALTTAVAFSAGGVLAPLAEAQDDRPDTERAERREQRMQNREERLQRKVDEGVITQERADEIRARHAERSAGREERRAARTERRDALAATFGMTTDELKAERRAGNSLADLAETAGVDIQVVIDQLVDAKEAHLSDAVAAGRIDQATADERLETIRTRITTRLTQ